MCELKITSRITEYGQSCRVEDMSERSVSYCAIVMYELNVCYKHIRVYIHTSSKFILGEEEEEQMK